MSGTTTNEGYPYPSTTDFLDVQDAYRLAMAVDSDLRTAQAPFRSWLGTPSFIARSSANSSTVSSGTQILTADVVEWDNTGGLLSNQWVQPNAQGPSWWMFGLSLLTFESGTPTIGDMLIATLNVSTQDQVTGLYTNSTFWQRNDDSNTNGEWINVFTMVPIYRGNVYGQISVSAANSKGISAGSRMWGIYMGPVS